MKKFIIAALLASITSAPVLAAPYGGFDGHNDRGRVETSHRTVSRTVTVRNDRRPDTRNWQRGQRFESRYAPRYRVIANPTHYRLRQAPRGYRWVQSGNDAVMVAIASGIVAAVMANAVR